MRRLAKPTVPSLNSPSTYNCRSPKVPDCGEGLKQPRIPEQPRHPGRQPQDEQHPPYGTQLLPAPRFASKLRFPSGEIYNAILFANSDAVILDEFGRMKGLMQRDGAWHPTPDELGTKQTAPDTSSISAASAITAGPDPVLPIMAGSAWRASPFGGLDPAYITTGFIDDSGKSAVLTEAFLSSKNKERQVLIFVDGWPLLTLIPRGRLDLAAFDWRSMRVLVGEDFDYVAFSSLAGLPWSRWRVHLHLPLASDERFFTLSYDAAPDDAPQSDAEAPIPAPADRCKPIRLSSKRLRRGGFEPFPLVEAITLADFKGGTVRVETRSERRRS